MRRSRRMISVATAVAILIGGLSAPAALAADPEPTATPSAGTSPEAESRATDPAEALREREWGYAQGFGAARDTKGIMLSLYRGKWFVKKADQRRRCILKRESQADYKAVSVGGKFRGGYQMSRPLMRGAAWMMRKEVRKEMGSEGVAILKKLHKTKSHLWNRYWQDRAFWTIWARGEGRGHWRSTAFKC